MPDAENNQSQSTSEGLSLESTIESLLFVADGPVPVSQLATALAVTPRRVEAALRELEAYYQARGVRLQWDKDRVQLTTAPEAAEVVEHFLGLEMVQRLSKSALEALAIIAYRQPVTRPQVDAVRGVNSDSVIKTLHAKGLIEEVGRTDGPGRPILFGTTPEFLQHFGFNSLDELPPLEPEEKESTNESEAPSPGSSFSENEKAPTVRDDPAKEEEPDAQWRSGPPTTDNAD